MARLGIVLYRGPSKFSGETIEAIATESENKKTRGMLVIHILPTIDVAKADRPHLSVCPSDCPFHKACYVNWSQSPPMVQRWHSGKPVWTPRAVRDVARGRSIRIGAEGDPCAVPVGVWRNVLSDCASWTSYTHAWRDGRNRYYRPFSMASVESPAQALEAIAKGWRTYRVRPRDTETMAGEIDCPSSRGVLCASCGLCKGEHETAPTISIPAHGGAVSAREANRIALAV